MSVPVWAQTETLSNGWKICIGYIGDTLTNVYSPLSVSLYTQEGVHRQTIFVTTLDELEDAKSQFHLLVNSEQS